MISCRTMIDRVSLAQAIIPDDFFYPVNLAQYAIITVTADQEIVEIIHVVIATDDAKIIVIHSTGFKRIHFNHNVREIKARIRPNLGIASGNNNAVPSRVITGAICRTRSNIPDRGGIRKVIEKENGSGSYACEWSFGRSFINRTNNILL